MWKQIWETFSTVVFISGQKLQRYSITNNSIQININNTPSFLLPSTSLINDITTYIRSEEGNRWHPSGEADRRRADSNLRPSTFIRLATTVLFTYHYSHVILFWLQGTVAFLAFTFHSYIIHQIWSWFSQTVVHSNARGFCLSSIIMVMYTV